jgi:hypothetical protein
MTSNRVATSDTVGTRLIKWVKALKSKRLLPSSDTTSISSGQLATTTPPASPQPQAAFLAPICPNAGSIGTYCNIANTPCATLRPCQNHGNCTNTNTTSPSYVCSCPSGFDGTHCQLDRRPCQTDTCKNNGTCNETSPSTAVCSCVSGWQGARCETQVNFCANVSCLNNGVCRASLLNYTCQCLGESFSGRHCEIKASETVAHQKVSRSFAYVAIIALGLMMSFIVMLDVLKYGFGIDPVTEDEKRKIRKRRNPPVAIRFVYVNLPSQPRSANSIELPEETFM